MRLKAFVRSDETCTKNLNLKYSAHVGVASVGNDKRPLSLTCMELTEDLDNTYTLIIPQMDVLAELDENKQAHKHSCSGSKTDAHTAAGQIKRHKG